VDGQPPGTPQRKLTLNSLVVIKGHLGQKGKGLLFGLSLKAKWQKRQNTGQGLLLVDTTSVNVRTFYSPS
jgi:hypothetical protein